MKKGIYIHYGSKTTLAGVEKKIHSQIKFFSTFFLIENVLLEKEKTNFVKSILWRLPFGSWGAKYDDALNEIERINKERAIDFIYIRKPLFDRKSVCFLKQLRNEYKNAKIIMEIPTFPYNKELMNNKTMWPWFFKDIVYRNQIAKYIDKIVTYSTDNYIYGIPTIKTMNGMDINSFDIARSDNNDDSIRLIGVAMMQPYHGFERIIKGLSSYYRTGGDRKITIDFVGYGTELDYYKELTEKKELTDRIIFKGKLEGEELERVYDNCDLAIGSMAGYKIGIEVFSSIKLGEYLAKGLPVVTGARTLIFEKYGYDYNLNFPNDDSEIDIYKVVDFYDKLYKGKDKNKVHSEIHEFAKNTVDNSIVMRDIVEYIEK